MVSPQAESIAIMHWTMSEPPLEVWHYGFSTELLKAG
jgi:hypothetical protein